MNEELQRYCDEIDAAIFSGDTFNSPTARLELRAYLERWSRELDSLRDAACKKLFPQL